ncbi:MAG: aminotransferase class I/II-fold pyridoxal phosphate-dependent enzyme [Granulosicoccus sp.]
MTIQFTTLVQRLPDTVPFIGPETLERSNGQKFKARIGANESAFGISPLAQKAIEAAAGIEGCSWYGDPENFELRSLLAKKHGVSINNICVDAGIDSLLGLSIRLFIEPGDGVVTSLGAYPTVNYHVNGFGGLLTSVPYKMHHEDPVALAKAAHEHKAKLVYLANPDNPMGTSLTTAAIQTLLDDLPEHSLLMLDEAYNEFMTSQDTLTVDVSNPKLIRYRTFSKAYGLAGMRIGYAIAHEEIIKGFNKIRNHFGVNRLAQIAALTSLQDADFLGKVVKEVKTGRQKIYDLATNCGLPYLTSDTNFVAVDIGDSTKADTLIATLGKQGVFVRKPMVAPQNCFIRIGIGSSTEHDVMVDTLEPLLAQL